jgi:hypothetical protein
MTGFDRKCLHLMAAPGTSFLVEVDFLGDGTWRNYTGLTLPVGGYVHHEFPSGFGAHWVRLVPNDHCVATAHFVYT